MYNRKTVDSFEIHVNYGQGWEHECTEWTRHDAVMCKKTYQENCTADVKIVMKRIKVSEVTEGMREDIKAAKERLEKHRRERLARRMAAKV